MNDTPVKVNSEQKSLKTPGGISKSFLTPCRRVGLSRYGGGRRKNFISPLSSLAVETKVTSVQCKKRKLCDEEIETSEGNGPSPSLAADEEAAHVKNVEGTSVSSQDDLNVTPKSVKPESKLSQQCTDFELKQPEDVEENGKEADIQSNIEVPNNEEIAVLQPVKVKSSKTNKKFKSSDDLNIESNTEVPNNEEIAVSEPIKVKSLNINKTYKSSNDLNMESDTEVPNNEEIAVSEPINVKSLNINKTLKSANDSNIGPEKKYVDEPLGLSLFEDDDDLVLSKIKSVMCKSSEVKKPQKSRSTSSITQREVDQLRARLEVKKKILLAKMIGTETEELIGLIKKWKKGCQDALVELLELIKTKVPDKNRMDYSELLQMLQIPPNLVGYDTDNDFFLTPDSANVILEKFNV